MSAHSAAAAASSRCFAGRAARPHREWAGAAARERVAAARALRAECGEPALHTLRLPTHCATLSSIITTWPTPAYRILPSAVNPVYIGTLGLGRWSAGANAESYRSDHQPSRSNGTIELKFKIPRVSLRYVRAPWRARAPFYRTLAQAAVTPLCESLTRWHSHPRPPRPLRPPLPPSCGARPARPPTAPTSFARARPLRRLG